MKSKTLRRKVSGGILCADKDDTEVRYSVLHDNPQLVACLYRLVLPSKEELRNALEQQHVLDWDTGNDDDKEQVV